MIAAIINFCTTDSRFIKACVEQTHLFADQIIVPVCNRFFDGSPEDTDLLDQIYRSIPDCQFIEYPFIAPRLPRKPLYFWHNFSRYIGYTKLDPAVERVFFIDADEIPDGKRVAQWLAKKEYKKYNALKLLNYWYFREPIYQALSQQASILMVKPSAINQEALLNGMEREGIFDAAEKPKQSDVVGLDGQPLFHHYSWVRTKDEMIKKTSTFNHRRQKNWNELIEKEFSSPFSGTDFVHGFKYKTVEPSFGLSLAPPEFEPILSEPAVKRINIDIEIKMTLVPDRRII